MDVSVMSGYVCSDCRTRKDSVVQLVRDISAVRDYFNWQLQTLASDDRCRRFMSHLIGICL